MECYRAGFGSCLLQVTSVFFVIFLTHNNCSHTYHVNGCVLPMVDSIRDLDITVDNRLNFDKHIAQIVHKVMSRCIVNVSILETRL